MSTPPLPDVRAASARAALASLALGIAAPALGADMRVLTIQPIAVCNTDGTGCGNAQGLINQALPYIGANFVRYDTAVTFLPVTQFRDTSYTTTVVDQNALTDQSRRLMRDPGHGQNANPQVLNMFFVPKLLGAPGQQQPIAYSFVNGNGLIIGPAPRTDTISHEIAHNLGLDHTTLGAGGSSNLSTTGTNRISPTSTTQVIGGSVDQLTTQQVGQVRSPLFSVGQTRMVGMIAEQQPSVIAGAKTTTLYTVSPDGYPNLFRQPGAGGLPAGQFPAAPSATLPPGQLTQVRVRFLSSTPAEVTNSERLGRLDKFTGFVTSPSYQCGTSLFVPNCTSAASFPSYTLQGTRATPTNAIEFVWNMQGGVQGSRQLGCTLTDIASQGCYAVVGAPGVPATPSSFRPYDAFTANFYDPVCAAAWTPGKPLCAAPKPFSVQFNYSNGFSSQGFYDTNTGIIDPLNPNLPGTFTWLPGFGPEQTLDPSQLPVPTRGAIEYAFAAVPEPALFGPFAMALGLLGAMRRRRA